MKGKGKPRMSEAQYQSLVRRYTELVTKAWENGGREEWEKKHPNWREEQEE